MENYTTSVGTKRSSKQFILGCLATTRQSHEQGLRWTIEAHVLSDNRLQQCQRHQTDIRTFEQPFLTARSTIWHRRNGSCTVWTTKGTIMHYTFMQEIPLTIDGGQTAVDSIEEFTLTHALHNDRRRLVMNWNSQWNHEWAMRSQVHTVRRNMLS